MRILFIVLLVFFMSSYFFDKKHAQSDNLLDGVKVIVRASKDSIVLGDKFKIEYEIINNSDRDYRFLETAIYRDYGLKFDGLSLKVPFHVQPKLFPEAQDFIEIKSKQSKIFFIDVVFKEGSVKPYREEEYTGKYLLLDVSDYVLLHNFQTISFRGKYHLFDFEGDYAQKYSIDNLYDKDLESPKVEIKIQ